MEEKDFLDLYDEKQEKEYWAAKVAAEINGTSEPAESDGKKKKEKKQKEKKPKAEKTPKAKKPAEESTVKAPKEKKAKTSKESLPSKTTLNLFYKEDKTTGPATMALYIMFVGALLIAFLKFGVYDIYAEAQELKRQVEEKQNYSDTLLIALKDYNKVKAEYSRYTQNYLKDGEILQDRVELLNVLEETVFALAYFKSVSIIDDSIFLNYTGLDLEETAALVLILEGYNCVKDVTVQAASLSVNDSSGVEEINTSMIIELWSVAEMPKEEVENEK